MADNLPSSLVLELLRHLRSSNPEVRLAAAGMLSARGLLKCKASRVAGDADAWSWFDVEEFCNQCVARGSPDVRDAANAALQAQGIGLLRAAESSRSNAAETLVRAYDEAGDSDPARLLRAVDGESEE